MHVCGASMDVPAPDGVHARDDSFRRTVIPGPAAEMSRDLEASCGAIEVIALMHIVGLCGSLRQDSYNRRLLLAASAALPDDATFLMVEDLATLPAFNADRDTRDAPPAVVTFRRTMRAASGLLVTTPEYNGSVPGWLKNAIDWVSRPYPGNALRGKPVLVAGASVSPHGAVRAQADLRRVLEAAGASVLDTGLAVPEAHEAFAMDGELLNRELGLTLVRLVGAFVARIAEQTHPVAGRPVG